VRSSASVREKTAENRPWPHASHGSRTTKKNDGGWHGTYKHFTPNGVFRIGCRSQCVPEIRERKGLAGLSRMGCPTRRAVRAVVGRTTAESAKTAPRLAEVGKAPGEIQWVLSRSRGAARPRTEPLSFPRTLACCSHCAQFGVCRISMTESDPGVERRRPASTRALGPPLDREPPAPAGTGSRLARWDRSSPRLALTRACGCAKGSLQSLERERGGSGN